MVKSEQSSRLNGKGKLSSYHLGLVLGCRKSFLRMLGLKWKDFYQPIIDFQDIIQISANLERGLYEESEEEKGKKQEDRERKRKN